MEEMEEEPLEGIEDDNHNYGAEGVCVSVCSPAQVCVDDDSSSESDSSGTSATHGSALLLNSAASKFREFNSESQLLTVLCRATVMCLMATPWYFDIYHGKVKKILVAWYFFQGTAKNMSKTRKVSHKYIYIYNVTYINTYSSNN